MSAIHAIVVAIQVASDVRNPRALVPSRIAAAGIRTDPARGLYEPSRCLYTSPVACGQQRHHNRPRPTLPQALDALCQAAHAFGPNLAVAHDAAFLARHVPGLFDRLVPADPRPACTERLARKLWPAAPSFEEEHLCYWRELLADDAHQHPDFPIQMNPFWIEAIRQEWDDAELCAMLFGDIRRTIEATGREVTPAAPRLDRGRPAAPATVTLTGAGRGAWASLLPSPATPTVRIHRKRAGRRLSTKSHGTFAIHVAGARFSPS